MKNTKKIRNDWKQLMKDRFWDEEGRYISSFIQVLSLYENSKIRVKRGDDPPDFILDDQRTCELVSIRIEKLEHLHAAWRKLQRKISKKLFEKNLSGLRVELVINDIKIFLKSTSNDGVVDAVKDFVEFKEKRCELWKKFGIAEINCNKILNKKKVSLTLTDAKKLTEMACFSPLPEVYINDPYLLGSIIKDKITSKVTKYKNKKLKYDMLLVYFDWTAAADLVIASLETLIEALEKVKYKNSDIFNNIYFISESYLVQGTHKNRLDKLLFYHFNEDQFRIFETSNCAFIDNL